MIARLDASVLDDVDGLLGEDESPAPGGGLTDRRQPVHTVYVPADRFTADLPRTWGTEAAALLAEHAPSHAPDPGPGHAGGHVPDVVALARIVGLDPGVVAEVLPLVHRKLADEPIEDLRVDFEDGLAPRSGTDEDTLAERAGREVGRAVRAGWCAPFVGIRFASLEPSTRRRGIRTLDLFVGALADTGTPPPGLIATLPKVTSVAHVAAMERLCDRLETAHGLPGGWLRYDVQIELPRAILDTDGTATVARLVHAASDRLVGLHYGTYDYSAACGIAAAYQSLDHPVADHAKAVMQLAAAGSAVHVSDGSTNVLPVGDTDAVHKAWAVHALSPPLPGTRLLPRLGSASRATSHPVPGDVRVLPGHGVVGGRSRAFRWRRRGAGRTGDDPRTCRIPTAGPRLRGADRRRRRHAASRRRRAGRDRSRW